MSNIIYIADPEIIAIPIIECHEPLVDIKDSTELLYGLPPECELTAACYTKMRKTIFNKLCLVQQNLPNGWRLRLYEGFRSLAVQTLLFQQEYARVALRHPNSKPSEIYHETTRLISPVKHLDGSENIPPHNTGAAVDVEIVTADGDLLEMGMAAKDWVSVAPELCMTNCKTIDGKARENRLLLLELMQAQGFVNYPTEWWHFSYGDRYWAYHRGEKAAIYGSVEKKSSLL